MQRESGKTDAPERRRSVVRSVLAQPRWLSALSVLGALAAWWAITAFAIVPAVLLPTPGEVASATIDILRDGYRETTLWQNVGSTLWRCGAGFFLAILTGVPLGLAMGYWPPIRAATNYIVQFMRPLPPLSYVILLIIWIGTDDRSKIVLLYLTAFPIVASSAMAGVRAVSQQRVQAARALGASEWQVFRYVILPSAMPLSFTGARIALAAAFSTVVAAELNAATDGLGWMVISASRFLRNDVIILGIILLGVLGVALSAIVLAVDRRVVHWRGIE
ncbi:MAG: ABC transporter permease subunit [Hyphomicrobiales bacterium]|nr:ABC transporter permease subunit [Hyphomicrobiales bacterium]